MAVLSNHDDLLGLVDLSGIDRHYRLSRRKTQKARQALSQRREDEARDEDLRRQSLKQNLENPAGDIRLSTAMARFSDWLARRKADKNTAPKLEDMVSMLHLPMAAMAANPLQDILHEGVTEGMTPEASNDEPVDLQARPFEPYADEPPRPQLT